MVLMKHTYLLYGMVVLLALSVAFCLLIYKKQYTKILKLRLDPLEEAELKGQFNSRFLAIGSSSISRWPFKEISLLQGNLFNAGVDGQTSAQILLRFEKLIKKHKPDYLILQAGANDIKSMGFLKDHHSIEKVCLENVKKILEECKLNGIMPVYITNFPTGRRNLIRMFVWNRELDQTIVRTNSEMKKFCNENGIYVFDAYDYLADGSIMKRKKEFSGDFMHLNKKGYKYLNQKLEQELQKIIK
jgi:lysophospholipase L1-like esterase